MTTLPRVGDEFAGYRLLAVLGRGGMSVVFQAENPRLGSLAALKVLSPELADNDLFRTRFLQECRTAASLTHPNVIPIYDMGSHDDLLFVAMRYVGGADLRDLIRTRTRLAPPEALFVVGQTGRALDLAHRNGLVHRDVKPANVLIEAAADADDSDHVYLTDFGIAKHALSESGLTGTGQFVGTARYVAPEQIRGERVDGRADIYSLGCVLFESLTGRVPFVRDMDAAVLWAHVEDAPPAATSLRPDLPVAIDAVIAQAMDKEPANRYDTCQAMMSDARAAFGTPHQDGRLLAPAASVWLPAVRADATQPPRPGGASPAAVPQDRTPRAPDHPAPARFTSGDAMVPRADAGGPEPDHQASAPGPTTGERVERTRRRRVAAAAVGGVVVVTVAVLEIGAWALNRDDHQADQAGRGTGRSSATMSGSDNVIMIAVERAGNGKLPVGSCQRVDTAYVTCRDPYAGVAEVDLRTYKDLDEVYRHYVAAAEQITGSPLRLNQHDCNGHATTGEVSWNHDYQHSRRYTLADSRNQTSDTETAETAAGRVFCAFTGDAEHFMWTDNAGLMLGTVDGYQHVDTWRWWQSVHHDLNVGYWASAAAHPEQSPLPPPSDMTGMGEQDSHVAGQTR